MLLMRCQLFNFFLALSLLFASSCLLANDTNSESGEAERLIEFSQKAYETRYADLIDELRCPKCQNQNLSDSNAPIAQDLKSELIRLLEEGKSDREILDFMTLRYGNFVLYQPPLNAVTISLWLIPLGVVVIGVLVWLGVLRGSAKKASSNTSDIAAPLEQDDSLGKDAAPAKKHAADEDRQQAVDRLIKQLGDNDD